jgi:uncharacterized protein
MPEANAAPGRTRAPKQPRGYINPYIGGALLGVVLFLSFYITGNGLGASAAINRVQVAILNVFDPGHVDRVGYMSEMGGGRRNALNHPSVFMLIGTILGGTLSGLLNRRMKVETRRGPHISVPARWATAFLGGLIMAYGARMARGCTSGQALSGGAVLSVGSFAFMFSIFIAAYALAWSLRRLWT